ncbi:TIGR00266 family protein [Vulcanisaeta thermophila]|uniref:TIGR00266 family protein n=1 Tax=Vulcanisaeta thermophila TaxID=867917 RepID=UPI0008533508|nr:TIGR00266 family protein [Vulcanisaeta thermophila]
MPEFKIMGNDIQHVLVRLGENEVVWGEGGHLIWKSSTVNLTARARGGILRSLERALTGASFFVLEVQGPGEADFAGFAPGRIVEINMDGTRGVLAEHRSFLVAESTVDYDAKLVGLGFGWLGGEGLLMARLRGRGRVFLHAIGDAISMELGPGESIDVEAGHVLAFEEGMKATIRRVGGLRTMLFGEEGIWLAHIEGPGRVWLRTLSRQQIIMGLMPELAQVVRST